ncbi:ComEC/Rec2 family competence protein [Virgibacillus kimchii]
MKHRFLHVIILLFVLTGCGQSFDQEEVTPGEHGTAETAQAEKETIDDGEREDSSDQETEASASDPPLNEEEDYGDQTPSGELEVHYIDAGQADATLFLYADEEDSYTILYDTGDWQRNDVVNYLSLMDVSSIDLVIASHPDADHIGQLAEIVSTFEVGEVWMSGNESSSQTFQRSIEAILASEADYHEPRTGEEFSIGPMEITVLYPENITGKSNEESVALHFSYGSHDFILTGDAGKREERQMVQHAGDLSATVLQLGHHGSNTSTDPAFLEAIDPEVAIYSAGKDNSYGHPHAEVVTLVQDFGIDLYGTDH